MCKKDLKLKIKKEKDGEIIEGALLCGKCDFSYPIEEGIPNLLPPEYHKQE